MELSVLPFLSGTGGNLLFDLDLYCELSPASRRLFLKLKDRFWRTKRVFMNVNDLTIHGLGFSATRPLRKRKFDLLNCIRELLDHDVLALGRGQTDPTELFLKRSKGVYVVSFYEGEYFRRPVTERQKAERMRLRTILLRTAPEIGVDGPPSALVQESWRRSCSGGFASRCRNARESRGFFGLRVSPAAFLVDGI